MRWPMKSQSRQDSRVGGAGRSVPGKIDATRWTLGDQQRHGAKTARTCCENG